MIIVSVHHASFDLNASSKIRNKTLPGQLHVVKVLEHQTCACYAQLGLEMTSRGCFVKLKNIVLLSWAMKDLVKVMKDCWMV